MTTRFALGDIVRFTKDDVAYNFTITEIKIDHTGKWYSGEDEWSIVGWHLEKHLELIS